MQKKTSFFFSFSNVSNFERSSKLRLSKQNAKEKFIFLFILEREYLRDKVAKIQLSEQNAKEKEQNVFEVFSD